MKVTHSQKLKIKVFIYWLLPRNNELVPPYIVGQREKRRRAWCAVFFRCVESPGLFGQWGRSIENASGRRARSTTSGIRKRKGESGRPLIFLFQTPIIACDKNENAALILGHFRIDQWSRYIKIQTPQILSVSRFLKTNFVLILSYEITFSCKFFIFIRMVIVHQTSLWWKGFQKATRKWGIVKLSRGLDWLQTFVLK